MTPLFNLLTPYNVPATGGLSGAAWGSGVRSPVTTSAGQLNSITQAQAGAFRPLYLPGFGPSLPAGNIAFPTDEMPGSIFTTGFPSITQDGVGDFRFGSLGVSRASRQTTDFMVPPVARDPGDQTPWQVKLSEWWTGAKALVVNPFTAGPARSVDQAPTPTERPTSPMLMAGALAVAGVAAAATVYAVARR